MMVNFENSKAPHPGVKLRTFSMAGQDHYYHNTQLPCDLKLKTGILKGFLFTTYAIYSKIYFLSLKHLKVNLSRSETFHIKQKSNFISTEHTPPHLLGDTISDVSIVLAVLLCVVAFSAACLSKPQVHTASISKLCFMVLCAKQTYAVLHCVRTTSSLLFWSWKITFVFRQALKTKPC